jgi:acyl carrier protein
MTSTVSNRVRAIVGDVLNLPVAQITAESSPKNIEAWDSVQQLNLILALEQEFGVVFDPEEYEEMTSVDRILTVVETKLREVLKGD